MALGAAAFGGAFGGGTSPTPGLGPVVPSVPPRPRPPRPPRWPSPCRPPGPRPRPPRRWSPGPVRSTSPTDTGRLTASVPGTGRLRRAVATTPSTSSPTARPSTWAHRRSPRSPAGTRGSKADLPKDASSPDLSSLAVLSNPSQLIGLLSSVGGQVTTVGHRRPPRHPDHRVPDHRHPVRAGGAGRHRTGRIGRRRAGGQGPPAAGQYLGPDHGLGGHGRLPPPDLGFHRPVPGHARQHRLRPDRRRTRRHAPDRDLGPGHDGHHGDGRLRPLQRPGDA